MNHGFRTAGKPQPKTKPMKPVLTEEERLKRAKALWPELWDAVIKGKLIDDQPPISRSAKEETARKK